MVERWRYERVPVDHVHDGDTIVVKYIDLGCDLKMENIRIRFNGINAPELATPEGVEARNYLAQVVAPGDLLTLESVHWDKYARRLDATVFAPSGVNLNDLMVAQGHAKPVNWAANA